MIRNFALPDTGHLVLDGRPIDIHNLYSVTATVGSVDQNRFEVHFQRNLIESPVPPFQPERMILVFEGDVKIGFNDLGLRNRPLEGDGIMTIAYFDEHCPDWGDFICEDMLVSGRSPQGVLLSFEWDFDLRIGCQRVTAIVPELLSATAEGCELT